MTFLDAITRHPFWDGSAYETDAYKGATVTQEDITRIQTILGYTLPENYVTLLHHQNGGIPINTCHATKTPTSWAKDHIAITGIMGADSTRTYSLCGQLGSQFMIAEWGYPPIGIYFANCPSAGHDMVCLDYRDNPHAPSVAHVDQDRNYAITTLAPSFEDFILGLTHQDNFSY